MRMRRRRRVSRGRRVFSRARRRGPRRIGIRM